MMIACRTSGVDTFIFLLIEVSPSSLNEWLDDYAQYVVCAKTFQDCWIDATSTSTMCRKDCTRVFVG